MASEHFNQDLKILLPVTNPDTEHVDTGDKSRQNTIL